MIGRAKQQAAALALVSGQIGEGATTSGKSRSRTKKGPGRMPHRRKPLAAQPWDWFGSKL